MTTGGDASRAEVQPPKKPKSPIQWNLLPRPPPPPAALEEQKKTDEEGELTGADLATMVPSAVPADGQEKTTRTHLPLLPPPVESPSPSPVRRREPPQPAREKGETTKGIPPVRLPSCHASHDTPLHPSFSRAENAGRSETTDRNRRGGGVQQEEERRRRDERERRRSAAGGGPPQEGRAPRRRSAAGGGPPQEGRARAPRRRQKRRAAFSSSSTGRSTQRRGEREGFERCRPLAFVCLDHARESTRSVGRDRLLPCLSLVRSKVAVVAAPPDNTKKRPRGAAEEGEKEDDRRGK